MDAKTEILKKHWAKKTIQPFDEAVIHHLTYALNAMDEYANKKAVEFMDWALKNKWKESISHPGLWMCDGKGLSFTTPDLYKIFEDATNRSKGLKCCYTECKLPNTCKDSCLGHLGP